MQAEWQPAQSILAIVPGEVHIWRFRLDIWGDCLERLAELLSEDEADRASRYRFDRDRRRFIVHRALVRLVIAGLINASPRRLAFELLPAGKPTIKSEAGLEFNSSDTAELGVVAAAIGSPLGIDVEWVRSDMDHLRVAERFFSSAERRALQAVVLQQRSKAFFLAWTRKEAYIKALGAGLSLPLNRFDVSLTPGEPARLLAAGDGLPGPDEWQLMNLDVGHGCAGALCMPVGNWTLRLWDLEPGWIETCRFG